MRVLLMSIKPEYSRRIFAGTKRFELRRTSVRTEPGDVVVVYESAPHQAVVGGFIVDGVRSDRVGHLWQDLEPDLGVTSEEYHAYFSGAATAHAIAIGRLVPVEPPVPLADLRSRCPGFRPPQSFMHWRLPLDLLLDARAIAELGRAA